MSLEQSFATCFNSSFNSNKASFGGVFLLKGNSELNVSKCSFVNNTAQYNGGVINSWYSRANFNSSIFIDNSATYGGVSYDVNNSYMIFNNSLFENNTAGATANNIYSVTTDLTVKNSIVLDSNNKTSIYCYNDSYVLDGNWWGVNNPRFEILTNGIMPNNWRLLKVNSTKSGAKYRLNVSINGLSDSTVTKCELMDRNIYFESSGGTFNIYSSTISSSIYNEYSGLLDDAMIIVDNEVLSPSTKTIPYLYVRDISTKINDNTTITVKCNPDITGMVEVRVNSSILTTLNPANGIAEYTHVFNSTWNVGRYDLIVSLRDDSGYANLTCRSILNINDNYNTTVTLIDALNKKVVEEENIIIPSSYDARDYGYVTSVKDQASSGSCWAFGTLVALESAVLKSYGEYSDLSANHMKNTLKRYSLYGDMYGEPDDGNNDLVSAAYIAGWLGPVTEEEDAYDDHSIMSPTLNSTIHVQDIYFIPARTSATDNDAIKLAIMKYGSVSTDIYAYTSGTNSYFTGYGINHCISIVGWDDNYSRYNFYGYPNRKVPDGNGAWIIKNSWGTGIGNGGYQYISYYDTSFGGIWQDPNYVYVMYNMAFPLNESETYSNIYQHETISNYMDFLTPSAWVRNVYKAEKNESIAAVGTFIYEDCDYEVHVYVNDRLCYSQNGTVLQEGFRTIKLDNYIPVIEGDVFRVDFKLKAHVGDYTVVTLQNTDIYRSFSKANQSFISTDGENWIDLYTDYDNLKNTAACLKVYTKETPVIYSTIEKTDSYYITTQTKNLNTSTGRLSYKINDEYYKDGNSNIIYVEVTGDGRYNIQIPSKNINQYEYNVTVIFENSDYVIIENITIVTASKNVTLTPGKLTYFVDEEQNMSVRVEIENNTYNTVLNSGVVLLYDTNGAIINKSNVHNANADFTMNLDAGTYNYTLYYRGSYAYNSEYRNITLNVIKHPVTIKITNITKKTIDDVTQIEGIALYDQDKALINAQLSMAINGKEVIVITDNSGKFNCSYEIETVGKIGITVTFDENATYDGASNYTEFTSKKHTTSITINNMSDIALGDSVEISGKLHDEKRNNVANATIDIYVNNNKVASVKTNQNGIYNCIYTTTTMGVNNITSIFRGNEKYTNTSGKKSFTIQQRNTKLTINPIQNLYYNDKYTITGKFTDINGNPIARNRITITLNNYNYYNTTDNTGIYTYHFTAISPGVNNVVVSWGGTTGTAEYRPSNATSSFNVQSKATRLTVNAIGDMSYRDSYVVSGVFMDVNGVPLTGSRIGIRVNNVSYYNTTDKSGVFVYHLTAVSPGVNSVVVSWGGAAGNGKYRPSNATTTFNVEAKSTKISIDPINNVSYNTNYTITGKFTDINGKPLTGSRIAIKVNNKYYYTTTDMTGTYTYHLTATLTGINNITVSWGGTTGSAKYKPANATRTFTVIAKST